MLVFSSEQAQLILIGEKGVYVYAANIYPLIHGIAQSLPRAAFFICDNGDKAGGVIHHKAVSLLHTGSGVFLGNDYGLGSG